MLRVVGDKLWAVLSSLGVSEELGVTKGDLETILVSTGISEDDLEALLEVFSLSDYKVEALISKALSVLNALGSNSTLNQKLEEVLSTLGVSNIAAQAAILGKAQQMLKSANISTAEVLAVVQHVQGFVGELSIFVADVEAAVKDLFDLADISDAGAADTFDKIVGFLTSLGISKADVKLAVDGAVGFFKSLSFKDVPALFADMHGLLVAAGVPHGSPQAAMYSFLNEAKALKSLILS